MQQKLYFYEVEDDYIEYLSKFDIKIMYSKCENRKFKRKYIGILFKIDNKHYIAPLSSFKEKHKEIEERIDFIKIGDKAVINLNNMFPVRLEQIKKVEIEEEKDYNYKELLRNEYKLCLPKFKKIITSANILYRQVTVYKMKISGRCCDFKLLEEKCEIYKKERN